MSLNPARAFGATAAHGGGLTGWLSSALERFNCYRRAWLERAQLLGLNDRELRDIGISRVDAWREADRPLRDNCQRRNIELRSPQP